MSHDFLPVESEKTESTFDIGVGALLIVVALILLACSPAIVIAVWQAAL